MNATKKDSHQINHLTTKRKKVAFCLVGFSDLWAFYTVKELKNAK